MTLSIMGLFETLSTMVLDIECCNAEYRDYLNAMMSVVMLNVAMLSVVAPSIIHWHIRFQWI